MKSVVGVILAALIALAALPARAGDKGLAASLAAAGARLAGEGKTEKARELCYKALANDEDCAEALYELGKLFEKDGCATAAAEFLVRATRELAQGEAANPAFASKRADAERRIRALNPWAARFTEIMTDYAKELGAVAKKSPDSLTLAEAQDRVAMLRLANIVPPEKLPSIDKPAAPASTTTTSRPADRDDVTAAAQRDVVTGVAPDVERALKKAGWDVIRGSWRKVSENVYEVTNGSLETPKVDGAVQLAVQKGGTGTIKMMVRNARTDNPRIMPKDIKGYGYRIAGTAVRIFSTSIYGLSTFSTSSSVASGTPYRDITLPDANAKNLFLITIQDGNLEMFVNGKREHKSNYKLPKEGPFVVEVTGTVTLESPQAVGR